MLVLLGFSAVASAQEDAEHWSELLIAELNEVRDSLNLPQLEQDAILEAAAYDQIIYCVEAKRLLHTQDNDKKPR